MAKDRWAALASQHGRRDAHRYFSDEPIAALRDGLDELRILGRVSESAAEFSNCDVDRLIKIAKTFRRPDLAAQLFPRDDLPGRSNKISSTLNGCCWILIRMPDLRTSPDWNEIS